MKKKIVFLLQNGIGFGHFKLALTIAHRMYPAEYEVIFITQAKSTRIFKGHPFKVFNIPPVYALKSNNEILLIHTLVNRLLNQLQPSLVIEDTYPDSFYLNLPALHYIPKVLLVNRLMGTEFENYYYSGILGQYQKLLCLKTRKDFCSALTSLEVRNFAEYSDRMEYVGNIFSEPSEVVCRQVRQSYQFDRFPKNVVVNCGAGGWHIGENVCLSIFREIVNAANRISEKVQFILLIGPYSSYLQEHLQPFVENKECVRFVDFDDNSDALFHEADLVVLRPGYNSTMEALAGNGRVLLIPGISYLEEQDVWCRELQAQYGIDYVSVENLNELTEHIVQQLHLPVPEKRVVENHALDAARLIMELSGAHCVPRGNALLCITGMEKSPKQIQARMQQLMQRGMLLCEREAVHTGIGSIPILNRQDNPQVIPAHNVAAFYMDEDMKNREFSFYQQRYHYLEQGMQPMELTEVCITELVYSRQKFLHVLGNPQLYSDCIVLNFICNGRNNNQILEFIDWLTEMLNTGAICCIPAKQWLCSRVNGRLHQYVFSHYQPEITKLMM